MNIFKEIEQTADYLSGGTMKPDPKGCKPQKSTDFIEQRVREILKNVPSTAEINGIEMLNFRNASKAITTYIRSCLPEEIECHCPQDPMGVRWCVCGAEHHNKCRNHMIKNLASSKTEHTETDV